jgi:hypothetical protein
VNPSLRGGEADEAIQIEQQDWIASPFGLAMTG